MSKCILCQVASNWRLLILNILCFVMVFLLISCNKRTYRVPRNVTLTYSDLTRLVNLVVFAADHSTQTVGRVDVDGDHELDQEEMIRLFTTIDHPLQKKYPLTEKIITKDGWLRDAWGRKFHVIVDSNNDGVIQLPTTNVKASVVGWSDGANGTNEFGKGDDVASWMSLSQIRDKFGYYVRWEGDRIIREK